MLLNRNGKGRFFPTGFKKQREIDACIYPENENMGAVYFSALSHRGLFHLQLVDGLGKQGKGHVRIRIKVTRA